MEFEQTMELPDPIDEKSIKHPPRNALGILKLYRDLHEARRNAQQAREEARRTEETQRADSARTIAALAAPHFEFERLLDRIRNSSQRLEEAEVADLLHVFNRSWASVLQREGIEVRDLSGQPLDEAVAPLIEVGTAIPDPNLNLPIIRETLIPLVVQHGEVVGTALVNTAVPAQGDSKENSS